MPEEIIKDIEDDEPDKIGEAEIPGILYYLMDMYCSIDNIDWMMIGNGDEMRARWKNKIINSIDYYIEFLP